MYMLQASVIFRPSIMNTMSFVTVRGSKLDVAIDCY